jgi:AcrR family transcriptional regulator
MEDIARAAGVGKGTLYRRYPDRASIAVALLDTHERALQEQLLRGPPPLGPGAYGFWRAHVGALLTQDGDRAEAAGDLDALVDVLLAPLAPELYQHQRHGRGRSVTEITAALTDLAQAVLGRGNGGAGRGPSR